MGAFRKYSALVLMAVYACCMLGSAWRSISCSCLAEIQHACCSVQGCVHGSCNEADAVFSSRCCDDEHSTTIDLYTASTDDDGSDVLFSFYYLLSEVLALDDACNTWQRVSTEQYPRSNPCLVARQWRRGPPVMA